MQVLLIVDNLIAVHFKRKIGFLAKLIYRFIGKDLLVELSFACQTCIQLLNKILLLFYILLHLLELFHKMFPFYAKTSLNIKNWGKTIQHTFCDCTSDYIKIVHHHLVRFHLNYLNIFLLFTHQVLGVKSLDPGVLPLSSAKENVNH